jgi:hypothetical protein
MSAPVQEPPLCRAAKAATRHFESLGNKKRLPNGRYGARFSPKGEYPSEAGVASSARKGRRKPATP